MKKLIPFLLILFLPACADAPPPMPSVSFRGYQLIYFKVGSIEVVEDYRSPMRAPNVEHEMQVSPADAVHLWVKQRLRASGGGKRLQVVIKDASVVEKRLATDEGLSGLFSSQVDREYNARLEVEVRIYGDAPLSEANVNVVGQRKLTLTESDSAATRDARLAGMVRELMLAMNAEMEKNIYQHMSTYVDYSKNP